MKVELICNDLRFEALAKLRDTRDVDIDITNCKTLYNVIIQACKDFIPHDEIEQYLKSGYCKGLAISFRMYNNEKRLGPCIHLGMIQTEEVLPKGTAEKTLYTYSHIENLTINIDLSEIKSIYLLLEEDVNDGMPHEEITKYGEEWWDYTEVPYDYISLEPSHETDITFSENFKASDAFMETVWEYVDSFDGKDIFLENIKNIMNMIEEGSCTLNWLVCMNEDSRIDIRLSRDTCQAKIHEGVIGLEEETTDEDDF